MTFSVSSHLIATSVRSLQWAMPYSEIEMDGGPYASLKGDDSSQIGDKRRKWTKKQKTIGAAVFVLLLTFTAGVVTGICTKGNAIFPSTTLHPVRIVTKTTVPSKTTTTQKTTVIPETTVTTTTTPRPSTTVTSKATITQQTTVIPNITTPETTVAPTTTVTSKTTETPVNWPSCENGSTPIFILKDNVTVGRQLRAIPSVSLAECSDHCALSEDCFALEFYNNSCVEFEKGSMAHTGTSGAKVLTKTCVKYDQVCSAPFHFALHEQMTLEGFSRENVEAETIEDCLAACLNANATYGFVCKSATFYPEDKECMLNTESHLDWPRYWYQEDRETVISLDNNCARADHTEDGVPVPTEDPTTCLPSFVRRGNFVLYGIDHHGMLDVTSVSECVHMCTERTLDIDFVCKSVEYYYDQKLCVLNAECSEYNSELFTAMGDDYKIDYFDVTRHLKNKTCPDGTLLRSLNALEEETGQPHSTDNNECMNAVIPSAPPASCSVSIIVPYEMTQAEEQRLPHTRHCQGEEKVEETKWSMKQKAVVVGVILLLLTVIIAVVVGIWRKDDSIDISVLPTGFEPLKPFDATVGMAGETALYLRFTLKVTAQFYHPGNRLDLQAFKVKVFNDDLEVGSTEIPKIVPHSNPATRIVQEGSITFVTFTVNVAVNRGDEGFTDCYTSATSLPLRFQYHLRLNNGGRPQDSFVDETIPVGCSFSTAKVIKH